MNKHSRESFIYRITMASTIFSAVLFFVIVLLELWIRWKINQNFTMLGNFELPSLALLLLGQLAVLSFVHRDR
ncbi:MAG: hypothetical protein JWM46_523 [Candidatus Kaiserbacteria bacterium]|nr:hypothetical protein [Candidatus Kaiserbacteria bacterium]